MKAATGDGGNVGGVGGRKRGGQSEKKQKTKLRTLSFRIKQKKRKKKKNKAGSTLILARRKPTRAVCSGWSYPIQAELSLVLGGVPVLPTFRGSLLWLKCVGSMVSLAVHSSA